MAWLLLALMAVPAAAEPITAATFGAIAEGRTLHFTLEGAPFGAEHYFAGRRSLWRFEGGGCLEGRWWAEGERICFRYEDGPAPQCWRLMPRPGGFAAELVADGPGLVLELAGVDTAPLDCPGPKVGS